MAHGEAEKASGRPSPTRWLALPPRPTSCRLYPPKESSEAFRGYVPSKRRYFYGLCMHLVVSGAGEPVEFALEAGSEADIILFRISGWTCPKARPSSPKGLHQL